VSTQFLDPYASDPYPAVSRKQDFTYNANGTVATSTWAGQTSSFEYSPAGWLKLAKDWRSGTPSSTFSLLPSGAVASASLGNGDASAQYGYHPDGSMSSLAWRDASGGLVASHTGISYDPGGQRIGETVEITRPATDIVTSDTGGTATFGYDLLGRLTSWTSPFGGTGSAQTTYDLDDAGNITERERAHGATTDRTTSTYTNSRLQSRRMEKIVSGASVSSTYECLSYTDLGEEKKIEAGPNVCGPTAVVTSTANNTYDPAGHTQDANVTLPGGAQTVAVSYVYDGHQAIARTNNKNSAKDRLLFYWGDGSRLAEETSLSGQSKVTYFRTPQGAALAQQKDGVWTWLLQDPHGSVGTHLKKESSGSTTITAQKAYDPYGAPDEGRASDEGTGAQAEADSSTSSLGFQGAFTDEATNRLILGPRQYDPERERFSTPDYFVQGLADLQLGTDPLTGNRYMFAGANPVAFYEDGHRVENAGGTGSCTEQSCPTDNSDGDYYSHGPSSKPSPDTISQGPLDRPSPDTISQGPSDRPSPDTIGPANPNAVPAPPDPAEPGVEAADAYETCVTVSESAPLVGAAGGTLFEPGVGTAAGFAAGETIAAVSPLTCGLAAGVVYLRNR
jgi:RHS repeat-associated protein